MTVLRREAYEDNPSDVKWHTPAETRRLLGMMSDVNRAKLDAAKAAKRRLVGAIYKRTRLDEAGRKVQRAEIRFEKALRASIAHDLASTRGLIIGESPSPPTRVRRG